MQKIYDISIVLHNLPHIISNNFLIVCVFFSGFQLRLDVGNAKEEGRVRVIINTDIHPAVCVCSTGPFSADVSMCNLIYFRWHFDNISQCSTAMQVAIHNTWPDIFRKYLVLPVCKGINTIAETVCICRCVDVHVNIKWSRVSFNIVTVVTVTM